MLVLLAGATRASSGGAAPLAAEPQFTALNQSPAATAVPYGAAVVVTATLDAQVVAGQSVYLRYSTDNFATCAVLPMTDASANGRFDFTASIPSLTPNPAKPVAVRYYAFTSQASTAPGCDEATAVALAASATNTFSYGVSFGSVSGPAVPTNCGNAVTATLAAAPAATNENFYLRFTTDLNGNFGAAGTVTQTLPMTVAGATATVTIPAQETGSIITYYVFSSTASTAPAGAAAPDLTTVLREDRNGGANYRFMTPAAVSISELTVGNATCANGNTGEVTFTVGGGVPSSYSFQLATNGGPFQAVTATKPAGEERYHIGGLVDGSRYQVSVSDGCGLPATTNSATIGSNNPAPTATLSNSGPVCAGGSTTVSFQLTGTAPWSLTYTNGVGGTVSRTGVTANPFTFSTGVLSANRTYTLTQLSDANGCSAQFLPLFTTVTVSKKPTITVQLLTPSVCAGNNATLKGTLTGAGPWTVYYTTTGNPEPQTVGLGLAGQTRFDYTFNTAALTVGGSNTVTITSVSDASCLAFPNSQVTVNVTANTTWTGTANSEWSNEGNWTNCIPSQYLDALIPLLTTGKPYPSYTSGQTAAEVKDLTIDSGASLTYAAGSLALYGNLTNNGTLRLTQGSGSIVGTVVSLNGSADQTISNLGEVYDLVVSATNGTATATLSGDVRVDHRLTATSGVLDTDAATITLAADQTSAPQGTATISESDASYVNGRVTTQRLVSTADASATFGGLGLSLTPSGAVVPGLTTVTRHTGPTAVATIFGRPGIARWFRITPAVDAGLNVALTLNYFDHERNGIESANLLLFSTPSTGPTPPTGPWAYYANSSVMPASGDAYGAVSVSGLSHLSDWTLGNRLNPLPVELTRFEARRAGPDAELSWTTASEKNSRGFEVQVSADDQQFRALHFVPSAAGNSRSPRSYAYLDREAGKGGARYYRLRQVDQDGTAGFSPVRVLHFEGAATLPARLSAVPNPFSSSQPLTLWVQSPLAAEAPLTITDVAGRLVRSQVLHLPAGASQVALPGLAELPAGVYLVQLPLGGQPQHLRVVKE